MKTTALHAEHQRLGAKLVDFAGWDMPIHYGSQLEEHHAVRSGCGMFDVAHMAAVDLHGARTREFLRRLVANDAAKLKTPGKALYTCMLDERAGVIDDLIVYFQREDWFRVVVNAGTTGKDLEWIRQQAAAFGIEVKHRTDLGILAVQGPQVRDKVKPLLPAAMRDAVLALKAFQSVAQAEWFVATTGYTGEDGYEFILPQAQLVALWKQLLDAGVKPCGLGARDTLRLEAGMNLYGQDMDESVTPLECGLAWTVAFDPAGRDFIGRKVLEAQRAAPPRKAVGLVLEGRGILRAHMPVRFAGGATGETTSGGFAPTMKASIALARVTADAAGACEVQIRDQWLPARVVTPPFVRNGKVLV
ncbi:MAG TPA: glycine cleavage system aminomethyltransferase GcvT [Candidatus Binatia bacterium]|nr:glycine cleavage system aminomethyltransferase GcvT [Candidatus Binatia bacterium]